MKHRHWPSHLHVLLISFMFGGCAALPFIIPPLIDFSAGLLHTALNNYDKPYNNDLQDLMVSLRQPQLNSSSQMIGNDSEQGATPYSSDEYQSPHNQNSSEQFFQNQNYPEDGDNEYSEHPHEDSSFQPSQEGHDEEFYSQISEDTSPIALDVLLVRKTAHNGAVTLLPIHDGDVMRDGRGNAQAGDKFRIMFRSKSNGFVYVISIDGSAWAQGVFPPPGNPFANPVSANQQYMIPEGNNWFSLDQFKGIETIFFVASHKKRNDIETIMTRIAGHERLPSDRPHQVTEAPVIPQGFSTARRSPSPFAITTGLQQDQQLLPTTFFAKTAGEALRVTRWFRHQ